MILEQGGNNLKIKLTGLLIAVVAVFSFTFVAYAQESESETGCEHLFSEYISDNNATYFSDGTKTAVCQNGCGETDTVTDEGTRIVLGRPEYFTVVTDSSSADLSWSSVEGATGYSIYYKTTGKWKNIVPYTRETSHRFENMSPGTKISFAVRACIKQEEKTALSVDYALVFTATKNIAPQKVAAKQNLSAIRLSWKECRGADGYRIYYLKNGAWKVCTKSTSATSVTYENLPSGRTYTFAIRPYIIADTVIWGEYAEFTTATLPAAPDVKLTLASKGKINLTWSKVSGADGYQIYYKVNSNKYQFYKAFKDVKKLSFNLAGDKYYTIAVRAVKKTSSGYIYGEHKYDTVHIGNVYDRIVINPNEGKWNLLLVNKSREIPASFKVKLASIPDGYLMDHRAAAYYNKMYADAAKEGIYLTPVSAYRTTAYQQELFDESVYEYMYYYDMTRAEAERKTSTEVLFPGTSEHNLGLAVDIGSVSGYFEDSAGYRWLLKNAHKYGFIERYTEEKQSKTGIIPEPWHWRFVGVEYAGKIKNSGLCLEEYLEKYNLIP